MCHINKYGNDNLVEIFQPTLKVTDMKYGDRRFNDIKSASGKVTLSARVDMRHVSTCLKHFINVGYMPRTKSDLIAGIIEGYAKVLRDNKDIQQPETNAEAYGFLRQYGLEPNTSAQGLRQALARDEIMLEKHTTISEIEEEIELQKYRKVYEERMKDLDTSDFHGNFNSDEGEIIREKKPTLPSTGGGIAGKVPKGVKVFSEQD